MINEYDSLAKYLFKDVLDFISDIEIGYFWGFEDDPVNRYMESRDFRTFNKFSDINLFKKHLNNLSVSIEKTFNEEFIGNNNFLENVPVNFCDRLIEEIKTEIRLIKTDINKALLFMDRRIHVRFEKVDSESIELMYMIHYQNVDIKYSYASLIRSANDYFNEIINSLELLNNKLKMIRLLQLEPGKIIKDIKSGLKKEIKGKIKKEIEETITDPAQKVYSISLDNAVDLFSRVIEVKLVKKELNDIGDRIYPAIHKYFEQNNRHDRLNMVKQMSQNFEPYLKKVLLLVEEEKVVYQM